MWNINLFLFNDLGILAVFHISAPTLAEFWCRRLHYTIVNNMEGNCMFFKPSIQCVRYHLWLRTSNDLKMTQSFVIQGKSLLTYEFRSCVVWRPRGYGIKRRSSWRVEWIQFGHKANRPQVKPVTEAIPSRPQFKLVKSRWQQFKTAITKIKPAKKPSCKK